MKRLTHFRTARISPALGQRLKRYARENDLGESAVIRLALKRFLPIYGIDEPSTGHLPDNEVTFDAQHTEHEESGAV